MASQGDQGNLFKAAQKETISVAPPDVDPQARTGWRIAPNDPAALAVALGSVLSLGATARDALSARARDHVMAHFSLDRMKSDTLDVYTALLEARDGPFER